MDLNSGINLKRNFWNFRPQASYEYKFSQFKSARFGYNGNTQQPTINQIQPIRINNDAFNISEGNDQLKPSFKNSVEGTYNSYKVVSSEYVYMFATYNFETNPIAMSRNTDITDTEGRSTYKFVNIDDKVISNFYMSNHYGKKVESLGFQVGGWLDFGGGTKYNMVNDVLNKLETRYVSVGININKHLAKKYYFYISGGPKYNTYKNSLTTAVNNNGGSFKSNNGFQIQLPGKLEISSEIEYNRTNRTQVYSDNVDYFTMNSSVTKKFFKDDKLRFSVSGNDLFNQNRGFSRGGSDNLLTQSSYTTINRYLLFSLIWDFNKMGGGLKPKN
jgi:hypothetical protein